MRSSWVGRVVLLAAALLLVRVGLAYVIDPQGATGASHITLGSNGAFTAMRVVGMLFVAIAAILVASLPSRRLLAGLAILTTIATAIFAMRLIGFFVDGSDAFTIRLLKPELALVIVSSLALAVERRRRRLGGLT